MYKRRECAKGGHHIECTKEGVYARRASHRVYKRRECAKGGHHIECTKGGSVRKEGIT